VGVAAAALGDAMGDAMLGKALSLLLDRLRNEITRLVGAYTRPLYRLT
jgi:hypothetical protein